MKNLIKIKKQIIYTGIIAAFILIGASNTKAQYFQRWFNYNSGTTAKLEVFYDGLCSRSNYWGASPTNYYNVAVGHTVPSGILGSLNGELRFVKTSKTGSPIQNYGFSLADYGTTAWCTSEGHAVSEVKNINATGGFMVVGSVSGYSASGAGFKDALITRIINNGTMTQKWRFNFNDGADELNSVISSSIEPGYFYACGTSYYEGYSKVIVTKFNSSATISWTRTYHFDNVSPASNANYCEAYGIAQSTVNGRLMVVGKYAKAGGSSGNDGLCIELDSLGNILSARNHHLGSNDQYRAVKYSTIGDYFYVCGVSNFAKVGINDIDMWLVKISSSTILFSKLLRQPGSMSYGLDVVERKNSFGVAEYFITGQRYNGTARNSIYKADVNGNGLNSFVYDTLYPYNYHFMGIDFASNDMTTPGVRVFSNTHSNLVRSDGYLLNAYFNGATCTNYCLFDPPQTITSNITVDSLEYKSSNTYEKTKLDTMRVNYTSGLICNQGSVSCGDNARMASEESNEETPLSDNSILLYPNPASDNLFIRFGYDEISGTIEILNLMGQLMIKKEIKTLEGEFETSININHLTKGTYILKFNSGKTSTVSKFTKS